MPTRDLPGLLDTLDPAAPQVERHLWLVALLDWIRGDRSSVATAVERLQLLIERLETDGELRHRAQAWWLALLEGVDGTTLLADHGFAQRPVFLSEFFSRLLSRLLPATPQTRDASELYTLLFPHDFDAAWLAGWTRRPNGAWPPHWASTRRAHAPGRRRSRSPSPAA